MAFPEWHTGRNLGLDTQENYIDNNYNNKL